MTEGPLNAAEEMLEVIDREANVLRLAPRSEIHGNPDMLHRVVHVLVFDSFGRVLLQKRSMAKDVAPGKWDTSVGGHVGPGEDLLDAARREMKEELGIEADMEFMYSYIHSNSYESEMVFTFSSAHRDGEAFGYDSEEIDELRFWEIGEVLEAMEGGELSDNFKHEIATFLKKNGHTC